MVLDKNGNIMLGGVKVGTLVFEDDYFVAYIGEKRYTSTDLDEILVSLGIV